MTSATGEPEALLLTRKLGQVEKGAQWINIRINGHTAHRSGLDRSTPTALVSHKQPLGRRSSASSSQAGCKRGEARTLQPFQQNNAWHEKCCFQVLPPNVNMGTKRGKTCWSPKYRCIYRCIFGAFLPGTSDDWPVKTLWRKTQNLGEDNNVGNISKTANHFNIYQMWRDQMNQNIPKLYIQLCLIIMWQKCQHASMLKGVHIFALPMSVLKTGALGFLFL